MAAVRAVFETTELLESIICFVPAHQIHSLKSVSIYWRQLIKTSPRTRRAQCVKPAQHGDGRVPICGPGPRLRIHAGIPIINKDNPCLGKLVDMSLCEVGKHAAMRLEEFGADYATAPRSQVLLITLPNNYDDSLIPCTLYVKDGIKIGDVLEIRDKLLLTHARYMSKEHPIPIDYPLDASAVFVNLAEVRDTEESSVPERHT